MNKKFSFMEYIRSEISYLRLIITLLVMLYISFSGYLWLKSDFLPNILITIQIQSTALLIGLIAAAIGLLNYWRKSGIKLEISISATEYNYEFSIKNLKDKEVSLYNLYLPITIENKEYQIDILKSEKEIKNHLTLKPYGQLFINLPLPRAIKVVEIITTLYPPDAEYIYIHPFIYKEHGDTAKKNNIILSFLRNEQRLKYFVHSSEGYKKGKTRIKKIIQLSNRLMFYSREDLVRDYLLHQGFDPSSDPMKISDDDLDRFIRERTTGNKAIKKTHLNRCRN